MKTEIKSDQYKEEITKYKKFVKFQRCLRLPNTKLKGKICKDINLLADVVKSYDKGEHCISIQQVRDVYYLITRK